MCIYLIENTQNHKTENIPLPSSEREGGVEKRKMYVVLKKKQRLLGLQSPVKCW